VRFSNDRICEGKSEASLIKYLTDDLPRNQELPEALRGAIASQIHLNEAISMIEPRDGLLDFLSRDREIAKSIRAEFAAAVKAYPANRAAYRAHVNWIKSDLDNARLTKAEAEPYLKQLADVMDRWTKALPDDAEPRLWLVDYYLENDETVSAKPHVEWLAASRQDDPRVRATPWKWQLLEAMRLSRRKAWLAQVPDKLRAAEAVWPAWLSKQWLPYLHAAYALRCEQTAEYKAQREKICRDSGIAQDSLADACMMLAAAQRMQVPAASVKALRAPVEAAVKNIGQLTDADLITAGGFFWDMHRTQLQYPAYRMHGSKLAKEMVARFNRRLRDFFEQLDAPQLQVAILWCAEHRFGSSTNDLELPKLFATPGAEQIPMLAAAKVSAFLRGSNLWQAESFQKLGARLREVAPSQRDAYYRYWFAALADELDEAAAKRVSRTRNYFKDLFNSLDFDLDDDDDLGFDPECDCPSCRAARKAYEATR
jgi:hypothetical protein